VAQFDPIAVKTGIPTVFGTDTPRIDLAAVAGLTTAALAAGDACQVNGALTMQKASSASTSPIVGVYDGTSGSVVREGVVVATMAAGVVLANGDTVYLSADSGKLTNVKPTYSVLHEVGVVVDAASRKILLQPKPCVVLADAPWDTPLPQLTWSSTTLVNVAAEPDQNALIRETLQDNVQRTFSGTITFNPAAGAVDGGLDTGVEGPSTWYYLYLVPSTGSNAVLAVRGSVTDPRTGPTGYTTWKYIGAVRNDAGSNLLSFWHWRNRFDYQTMIQVAYDASPTVGSLVATDLSAYVPVTASHARYGLSCTTAGNYGTVQFFIDGFTGVAIGYMRFYCGTNAGGYVLDDDYFPNSVPTPTIPKSVTHKLTNAGCAFTKLYRVVNGWHDGWLTSWMTP